MKPHVIYNNVNIKEKTDNPPNPRFIFSFFSLHLSNSFLLSVRKYDFKLEGGEWFKEGFRKLLSLE